MKNNFAFSRDHTSKWSNRDVLSQNQRSSLASQSQQKDEFVLFNQASTESLMAQQDGKLNKNESMPNALIQNQFSNHRDIN